MTAAAHEDRHRRSGRWIFVRDLAVIFVIALLVSTLTKAFLVRSFYIPSVSMERTLTVNDRILVNQLEPGLIPIARGHVIVFQDPGGWLPPSGPTTSGNLVADTVDALLKVVGVAPEETGEHLIKRVIGVPGDHVVCCNALGQLSINGIPIDEGAYIHLAEGVTAASKVDFDIVVPPDSLWVMGDNRGNSQDSRYHQEEPGNGFVPFENVTGRAFVISWPVNRWVFLDDHPFVFSGVEDESDSTR